MAVTPDDTNPTWAFFVDFIANLGEENVPALTFNRGDLAAGADVTISTITEGGLESPDAPPPTVSP